MADPGLARDLARAAARIPRTAWCVTVTDQDGHAVGHGCARPQASGRAPPRTTEQAPTGQAGRPGFTFTAGDGHGPPGGYGTWQLATGIAGQPEQTIALEPIATDQCDHRHQAHGHDPGIKLRHLSEIRHATCTAPTCRRPATQSDFEHNIPFEIGGLTCLCNGGPRCRHDHRVKQDPRWKVEQPTPAVIRWTTPSGRRYTTEPTRYPI